MRFHVNQGLSCPGRPPGCSHRGARDGLGGSCIMRAGKACEGSLTPEHSVGVTVPDSPVPEHMTANNAFALQPPL